VENDWILANIIDYGVGRQQWKVEDADEDDEQPGIRRFLNINQGLSIGLEEA
jgi:hypothetical protein